MSIQTLERVTGGHATKTAEGRAKPNGKYRRVFLDQLFFSTTDLRGVITGANSTFQQLSGFAKSELLGAPHNVIRHPDMPAGVFRLMWQRLHAGLPFAGYVRNLAKDGYTYWVFATVTPVAGGYLSVRSAPCAAAGLEAAAALYDQAVPLERESRAAGCSRAEAAARGQVALEQMLASAGFPTYDDFMFQMLPAETAARVAAVAPAGNGGRHAGAVGEIMDGAQALERRLCALLGRLDSLQDLADALLGASQDLSATVAALGGVTQAASDASGQVEERAPILASTARAMAAFDRGVSGVVGELSPRLVAVRETVMGLRFGIALSLLHTQMVLAFGREVLDRCAPAEGLAYVPGLCQAMSDDVDSLAAQLGQTSAALRQASIEAAVCREQFGQFQKLLTAWRLQVPRYGLSRTLGGLVAPIDQQLSAGLDRIAALRELAAACVTEAAPVERASLLEPIAQVCEAARGLDT